MNFEELQTNFENSIRVGEIHRVQMEIEALKASDIPRNWQAVFADIARRVRSEVWGLRLLRPLVRAEPPVQPPPNSKELCVYAGLLIKLGSLPEAEKILHSLNQDEDPQVLTFQSQIQIAQWDYQEAAICLKNLIARTDISEYQRCIAQVNLIAAYIFLEKFSQAEKLISEVLQNCLESKWDLLYGNTLELSAQVAVIQKDFAQSQKLLSEAKIRSGQHTQYSILIEKWRLIGDLLQARSDTSEMDVILRKIETLRSQAQSQGSWETVRDLDYQVALHLGHQNLLLNVYFGTPHSAYKKRIEKHFKSQKWKIPEFYIRKVSSAPATRVLDITTGKEDGLELPESLKPGKMLHRLLNILALDFYKPFGLGELFSKLHPDEYFNPDTAPARIAQAIKHLRGWFEEQKIPLDVLVEGGRYSLKADGPYALKIPRETKDSEELQDSGFEVQLQKLKDKWPYQSFSVGKAAEELQISATGVRIILKRALAEKRIYQSGAGRSTLYRFEK